MDKIYIGRASNLRAAGLCFFAVALVAALGVQTPAWGRTDVKFTELPLPSDQPGVVKALGLQYNGKDVPFDGASFSRDGSVVALGELWGGAFALGGLVVEFPSGKPIAEISSKAHKFSLSPDGKLFAALESDYFDIWRLSDGKKVRRFKLKEFKSEHVVDNVAFSPDDNKVAFAVTPAATFDLMVCPLDKGDCRKLASASNTGSIVFAFTPDWTEFAIVNGDNLSVYRTDDGSLVAKMDGNDAPYFLAFSQDGGMLAGSGSQTAQHSTGVINWRVRTGEKIFTTRGGGSGVPDSVNLSFSPDNAHLTVDSDIIQANSGKVAAPDLGYNSAVNGFADSQHLRVFKDHKLEILKAPWAEETSGATIADWLKKARQSQDGFEKKNAADKASGLWTQADGTDAKASALILRGDGERMLADAKAASADYQEALGLIPNTPKARFGLALVAAMQGRAADALKTLATLKPSFDVLFASARIEKVTGALDKAQADASKAVALNPQSSEAQSMLGSILMLSGHPDTALAAYLKALELDPKNQKALLERGLLLFEMGQSDKAIADLEQAKRLDSTNPQLLYTLSIIYKDAFARTGNHDYNYKWFDNIDVLERISSPFQQEARRTLGAYLIKNPSSDPNRATDILKEAVDADPNDDKARELYDIAKNSLEEKNRAESEAYISKIESQSNSMAKLASVLLGVAEGISAGASGGGGGGSSEAGAGAAETKAYNEQSSQRLQQSWANERKCGSFQGCP